MPLEYLAVRCYSTTCGMFQVIQKKKTNKWQCKVCHENQSLRKVYGQSYRAKDLRELVQRYNMDSQLAKESAPPSPPPSKRKLEEGDEEEEFHEDYDNDAESKQNKWTGYINDTQEPEEDEDVESDSRYTTQAAEYNPLGKKRRVSTVIDGEGDDRPIRSQFRGRGRGRGRQPITQRSDNQTATSSGSKWSYRPTVTTKGFSKNAPVAEPAARGREITAAFGNPPRDEDSDKQNAFVTSPSFPGSSTSLSRLSRESTASSLQASFASGSRQPAPLTFPSPRADASRTTPKSLSSYSTSTISTFTSPSSTLSSNPLPTRASSYASSSSSSRAHPAPSLGSRTSPAPSAPSSRWAAYVGKDTSGREDDDNEDEDEDQPSPSLYNFGSLGGRRSAVSMNSQFCTTAADEEVVEEERE